MSRCRFSPNQYIFVEQVLKSQVVPVLECANFVSLAESVTKARQADDGLVYLDLSSGDIQLFLGFLSETKIKVKDIDFVLSIVAALRADSNFVSDKSTVSEVGLPDQPDPKELLYKGESDGV
jgi:hypothetical protein